MVKERKWLRYSDEEWWYLSFPVVRDSGRRRVIPTTLTVEARVVRTAPSNWVVYWVSDNGETCTPIAFYQTAPQAKARVEEWYK